MSTRDDIIMWSFNFDDHPDTMGHGYGNMFGSIYSARSLDKYNNIICLITDGHTGGHLMFI